MMTDKVSARRRLRLDSLRAEGAWQVFLVAVVGWLFCAAGCTTCPSPQTQPFGYSRDCGSYCKPKKPPRSHLEAYAGLSMIAAGGGTAGVGVWKLVQAADRRDRAGSTNNEYLNDLYNDQADRFEQIGSWTVPIGGAVFATGVVLLVVGLTGDEGEEEHGPPQSGLWDSLRIVPVTSDGSAVGVQVGGSF